MLFWFTEKCAEVMEPIDPSVLITGEDHLLVNSLGADQAAVCLFSSCTLSSPSVFDLSYSSITLLKVLSGADFAASSRLKKPLVRRMQCTSEAFFRTHLAVWVSSLSEITSDLFILFGSFYRATSLFAVDRRSYFVLMSGISSNSSTRADNLLWTATAYSSQREASAITFFQSISYWIGRRSFVLPETDLVYTGHNTVI